eukprot:6061537-Pyramimonas_sp.AAC.1
MLLPRISSHCNLIPNSSPSASTAERVSHATQLRQPRSILPDFQDEAHVRLVALEDLQRCQACHQALRGLPIGSVGLGR